MSTIATTNIKHASSSSNNIVLNSDGTSYMSGHIIQVVNTLKQGTSTMNLGSQESGWHDIPGMSVSITPKSTSSKIHIQTILRGRATNEYVGILLVRDSTSILIGNSATGNRTNLSGRMDIGSNYHQTREQVCIGVDSPSTTSQITYKLQAQNFHQSQYFYLNTPSEQDNNGYTFHLCSTMTVMEIAG